MQNYRISTDIGKDKNIVVELKSDYDLIEVLSLKFTQQDIYRSLCADYGVVCGRISANNGLGIPNTRVSIFVPLADEDADNPVISSLYPYRSVDDKNDNNYRYNLLPSRQQHGGHEPTGTFFDQKDILTREEVLEVYEKYYNYTVKTNSSGDFMIWGVPLGSQTVHVDIDLSDIGCFSLRPDDFIRKGYGVDDFKTNYQFKSSNDLDSLPQIISFDKTIEVYPFWGNDEFCEIGISRVDFDLSDKGFKMEPMAYFIGSIYTDSEGNVLSRKCVPDSKMGEKCSLITGAAKIEAIRFTDTVNERGQPILEYYELNESIDEDGSFVFPVPMNMEYIYTNEYGENVITNDPNKGIPTSACYRFRITMDNTDTDGNRTLGSYLLPNIREYNTSNEEIDKSYNFTLNWDDYPTESLTNDVIFNNILGSYYPKDYFFRLTYNKVYTLSSFMGSYFKFRDNIINTNPLNEFKRGTSQPFLGLKEIVPKKENDCESSVVTPPVNWGVMRYNFNTLLSIIINVFERIIYTAFIAAIQILIAPFQALTRIPVVGRFFRAGGIIDLDKRVIEPLQRFGTLRLGIITYPECDTCNSIDGEDVTTELPPNELNPIELYKLIIDGRVFSAKKYLEIDDPDPSIRKYYITTPTDPQPIFRTAEDQIIDINTIWDEIYTNPERYTFTLDGVGFGEPLYIYTYIHENQSYYYVQYSQLGTPDEQHFEQVRFQVFDLEQPLEGSIDNSTTSINNETLPIGCSQYKTVYDETLVSVSYCSDDPSISYDELDYSYEKPGYGCSDGKVVVGQIIRSSTNNPCVTCETKSGFSEFRNGLFRIIPAAAVDNWTSNFRAIDEYCRRKLVGKLFCEGVVNYSFIDNWLSGSLYFFPFKSRVRWDNEENLDLNVRRTSYCGDLVYYKVGTAENPDKRFYYRSSPFDPLSVQFKATNDTLAHPTTMVDLGPRDEFIREICMDTSLDPNCSVVRQLNNSSYKSFSDMFGLYINYRMDVAQPAKAGNIYYFFSNGGYNAKLPIEMTGRILNGDILQLISINNEVGIDGFDLQNRKYGFYNPYILDPDIHIDFFKADDGTKNGPLPIKFELNEDNGYRVRVCLNEPGNLTESSQEVPFYYWNKFGTGFGKGINHSWDYSTVAKQPLQGMTYNYKYNGDTSHPYLLLPMTKSYGGEIININGVSFDFLNTDFDVEYLNLDTYNDLSSDVSINNYPHRNYNIQEEGFTFLYVTHGDKTLSGATEGKLYVRVGDAKPNGVAYDTVCWQIINWNKDIDYIMKPTTSNYSGTKQILSTPFLFYFGLRPGKTAIDKFINRFGPKNTFILSE